jgi:uncharacterized membrane protein YhaH (DUF805 family)
MESLFHLMLVSYFNVIRKFSDFSGRARRTEFWMFLLCNFIISLIFTILGRIPILGVIVIIISIVYYIVILVPCIAVGIRRLHDTNRPGVLMLLHLIPGVGSIIVLTLCALQGTPGDNQYGQDPRE